jgi:hypothetical protein
MRYLKLLSLWIFFQSTQGFAWTSILSCDGSRLVVDKERVGGTHGFDKYQVVFNDFHLASGLSNIGALGFQQYLNPSNDGVKAILNSTRGDVQFTEVLFDGNKLEKITAVNVLRPTGRYVSERISRLDIERLNRITFSLQRVESDKVSLTVLEQQLFHRPNPAKGQPSDVNAYPSRMLFNTIFEHCD